MHLSLNVKRLFAIYVFDYFFSDDLNVVKGCLRNIYIYVGRGVFKVTKSNIFDILLMNWKFD